MTTEVKLWINSPELLEKNNSRVFCNDSNCEVNFIIYTRVSIGQIIFKTHLRFNKAAGNYFCSQPTHIATTTALSNVSSLDPNCLLRQNNKDM